MRQAYDSLFLEDGEAAREGNHFDLGGPSVEGKQVADEAVLPQILGPDRYAPALRGPQLIANLQAIALQLLGEGSTFGAGAHAIMKPPQIGAATPWHQDVRFCTESAAATATPAAFP